MSKVVIIGIISTVIVVSIIIGAVLYYKKHNSTNASIFSFTPSTIPPSCAFFPLKETVNISQPINATITPGSCLPLTIPPYTSISLPPGVSSSSPSAAMLIANQRKFVPWFVVMCVNSCGASSFPGPIQLIMTNTTTNASLTFTPSNYAVILNSTPPPGYQFVVFNNIITNQDKTGMTVDQTNTPPMVVPVVPLIYSASDGCSISVQQTDYFACSLAGTTTDPSSVFIQVYGQFGIENILSKPVVPSDFGIQTGQTQSLGSGL